MSGERVVTQLKDMGKDEVILLGAIGLAAEGIQLLARAAVPRDGLDSVLKAKVRIRFSCAGSILFFQGLEQIIQLAFKRCGMDQPKCKQHEILPLFDLLSNETALSIALKNQGLRLMTARKVVESAEHNFMAARYFGQRGKYNFSSVKAKYAKQCAVAIVACHFPNLLNEFVFQIEYENRVQF